ncbi:adenosylmethionine--8-amino-7-oxononanoate transaminase [Christiangramia forsetii]|uniref:Adenosylmethionine-8-amino-7-oxononanoate aminotransferase n=2 Tax=Christiangramia forsetii TaxID=411153 RepID=A0M7A6_CHRFK|nr:adenosylmethionine--8-amino-7-oxononanoate transaminase [Christiangramia forsetii]GGG28322.1 adenosylmethionine--8-amino-7-oxononanoate aminotransferase BioA [Christiangramia forsetii]CAL68501.1 adenosylmethionine-8-amino-7-oxononanoate aminotransferase [Christiangramia forsetii KT0803]
MRDISLEHENLTERDKKHLWHPLTQHKVSPEMLPIKKAKGCTLTDEKGNEYIDGISSWYTAVYGHCNPYITEKVAEQMQNLDQVVFSGFTHEPAIALSEALIEILPEGQQKLFFNDNGSTATEIGIKMALQYHHNLGNDRKVMLAFEEGFHGDTFGAMSVSGLSVYNGAFEDHFIRVERIPVPTGENNQEVISILNNILKNHNIAGFIYEPLIQGAAAMKFHDGEGLNEILKICRENEVVLVADEVMTGFGKTGSYFASDYMQEKPDVVCMSKALTAGLLPMGLTSCSQKIYNAFYSNDIAKGLFHGHTYTANPLACAAALAAVQLLRTDEIQTGINRITESNMAFTAKLKDHPKVKNVRSKGVIFAFELAVETERYGGLRNKLFKFFMDNGVFLRPLGNTIYIVPPYVISEEELQKIYSVIEDVLSNF